MADERAPIRALFCGDRDWTLYFPIDLVVAHLPPGSVVIHGAAPGADTIAGECAESRGFKVEPYPAEWTKFGRGAGPIRNQLMLDEGKPDRVYAFHDHLAQSKGTRDMVDRARKAGVPVLLFDSNHGRMR